MSTVSDGINPVSEAIDLRGLKGWLVLVGIGLCVTPLRLLKGISEHSAAFKDDTWNALTTPGSPAYHPLWAPLLIGEMVGNLALLAGSLFCLWLFFGKRRLFPRTAISLLVAGVVVTALDLAFAQAIPAAAAEVSAADIREVIQAGIGALIWISYLLHSRRVRVTFVE